LKAVIGFASAPTEPAMGENEGSSTRWGTKLDWVKPGGDGEREGFTPHQQKNRRWAGLLWRTLHGTSMEIGFGREGRMATRFDVPAN